MERILKSELQTKFSSLDRHFNRLFEDYPEYDKFCVIAELLQGESVIWGSSVGFAIGRPMKFHNKESFLLEFACGDDVSEMLMSLPAIEEEIKAWGFDEIKFSGRLGWKPVMKKQGYELDRVTMTKELGE